MKKRTVTFIIMSTIGAIVVLLMSEMGNELFGKADELETYFHEGTSKVTIINNTEHTIENGSLTISSGIDTLKFENLLPNKTLSHEFENITDGSYRIKIVLNNTIHIDSFGYVTHSTDFNDSIYIKHKSDSIAFDLISKLNYDNGK